MTDIVERLQATIINETPARYPEVINAAIHEIKQMRLDMTMMKLKAQNAEKEAEKARRAAELASAYAQDCVVLGTRQTSAK